MAGWIDGDYELVGADSACRSVKREAELGARRLRAAELPGQGMGTNEVARRVGVTPSCVST